MEIRPTDVRSLGYNDLHVPKPIIDVETDKYLQDHDGDPKQLIPPTIIGILYEHTITQIIREKGDNVDDYIDAVIHVIDQLPEPFYAFNCHFDRDIVQSLTNMFFPFREIAEFRNQYKRNGLKRYGISIHDPFYNGKDAIEHYKKYSETDNKKFLELVIEHNQVCLLSEGLLLTLPIELKLQKAIDDRRVVDFVYPTGDYMRRQIAIRYIDLDKRKFGGWDYLREDWRNFLIDEAVGWKFPEEKHKLF